MPDREFTVASDRVAGCSFGDTVAESDLEGVNVDALVAAGHLKPAVKRGRHHPVTEPPDGDEPPAETEQ